jgi:hypothetical protein
LWNALKDEREHTRKLEAENATLRATLERVKGLQRYTLDVGRWYAGVYISCPDLDAIIKEARL